MKSKSVLRFSGDGDVTNMFEYPNAVAAASARPSAADLPRPGNPCDPRGARCRRGRGRTASGGEGDGGAERLLGDGLNEGDECAALVERLGLCHERTDWLRVRQRLLQRTQLARTRGLVAILRHVSVSNQRGAVGREERTSLGGSGSMVRDASETGSTVSSSSITSACLQFTSDSRKRSLNRALTSVCASVT